MLLRPIARRQFGSKALGANAEKSLTVPLCRVRMCYFPVFLPEYCPILQCLNLSDANSVIYKWVPLKSSR